MGLRSDSIFISVRQSSLCEISTVIEGEQDLPVWVNQALDVGDWTLLAWAGMRVTAFIVTPPAAITAPYNTAVHAAVEERA